VELLNDPSVDNSHHVPGCHTSCNKKCELWNSHFHQPFHAALLPEMNITRIMSAKKMV